MMTMTMVLVMMVMERNGICCQQPGAGMVKQLAASSTNLSHRPTEGTVLTTDLPRESRLEMPHCPRKVASSRLPPMPRSPLLGQGEGTPAPAPPYLRP